MDPTWEETSDGAPARDPASLTPVPAAASAAPSWDDTQPISKAPGGAASADPSWDDTTDLQSQYGTPGQAAIAGIEGAGRGVLGPIFTGAERLAGISPEGIRLRQEANPWVSGLSEFGSFAGTTALTLGASAEARAAVEAGEITAKAAQGTSSAAKIAQNFTLPGLVEKFGAGAQSAVGLGDASGLAKILAVPVKLGAEWGAYRGVDEINKAIEQDPDQTIGTAASNIGLSTLFGAGLGVPLGGASIAWGILKGPTAEGILQKIKTNWGMGDPLAKEEEIVSPLLKRALNVLPGGVPIQTMEDYAAQREAVMAAPEFQDVYSHSLDHILDMQDNLATKKMSVAQAKSAFNEFLDQQRVGMQQAGRDATAADQIARQLCLLRVVPKQQAQDNICINRAHSVA